jgi:hypothetical protein
VHRNILHIPKPSIHPRRKNSRKNKKVEKEIERDTYYGEKEEEERQA